MRRDGAAPWTALVHGSTTAVFAMISKTLADRHPRSRLAVLLPGGALVVVVHSFFNHFVLNPLLATALLPVVLPLMMIIVFDRSREATRDWLGAGFDDDVEFLSTILAGEWGRRGWARICSPSRRASRARWSRTCSVSSAFISSCRCTARG